MPSDRLTAIVRDRYETGAYGNAFLVMSKATVKALAEVEPPELPYAPWGGALGRLWDIPVILDAAMPVGAWRLLDRTTGEEIEAGS